MAWIDVVAIITSCVMFIHMGLVDEVLALFGLRKDLPIVTCPKCLTFHCVLWFLFLTGHNVIHTVAVSFLASYCAIWLDMFLSIMDKCYVYIYRKLSEDGGLFHQRDRESTGEDNALPKV